MITSVGLRCWLDAVAECEYGAGLWFGTKCSSFVGLCRHGHGRSAKNGYWGHRKKNFVMVGNLMMVVGFFRDVPSTSQFMFLNLSLAFFNLVYLFNLGFQWRVPQWL